MALVGVVSTTATNRLPIGPGKEPGINLNLPTNLIFLRPNDWDFEIFTVCEKVSRDHERKISTKLGGRFSRDHHHVVVFAIQHVL